MRFIKHFAITGAIVFLAISAMAEEPSSKTTSFQWNKPYAGLALGGSYSVADPTVRLGFGYFNQTDANQLDPLGSKDLESVIPAFAAFAGFNHQQGNVVCGLEGEFIYGSFDDTTDTGQLAYDSLPGAKFDMRTRITSSWMASIRGRLGYAHGKSMAYISAGPALSSFSYQFDFSDTNVSVQGSFDKTSLSLGWTAGVGYERMLNDNWGLRAGYQHYEFPDIMTTEPLYSNQAESNHRLAFTSDMIHLGIFKTF